MIHGDFLFRIRHYACSLQVSEREPRVLHILRQVDALRPINNYVLV